MIVVKNISSDQINLKEIKKYSEKIIASNYSIEIVFVRKNDIKLLNKQYRKIDKETDILTFTDEKKESTHQIIICPEIAKKNGDKYGNSFEKELKLLIFHGWKHIIGNHHL